MKLKGQIYLIEDDASMRQSLVDALPKYGYLVSAFSSAKYFMETEDRLNSPAVILLDMQMPDLSGIELQAKLLEKGCRTPIIFVSGQSHPQQIINSLKKGAADFILKPFLLDDLDRSIQLALKRDIEISELYQAFESLTPKEHEVFMALAQGQLLKKIAQERDVSESVIKMHKSNLMKKLQIKSLQDLTIRYMELGLHNKK